MITTCEFDSEEDEEEGTLYIEKDWVFSLLLSILSCIY